MSRWFSFSGRASRRTFWVFAFVNFAVMVALMLLGLALGAFSSDGNATLTLIWIVVTSLTYIVLGVAGLALSTRRWHDRNKSGWWFLIGLVPLIGGIWALVEQGFMAGTDGPNRFGSPEGESGEYVLSSAPVYQPYEPYRAS